MVLACVPARWGLMLTQPALITQTHAVEVCSSYAVWRAHWKLARAGDSCGVSQRDTGGMTTSYLVEKAQCAHSPLAGP